MTQHTLLPDDPKLTAYALGELEGDERAAVEAMLRENPAARAAVEEIRATASQLTSALASEVAPETAPLEFPFGAGRNHRTADGGPSPFQRRKVLNFPQLYYIIGLGAAACFALVVALREPVPPHGQKLADRPVAPVPSMAEEPAATPAADHSTSTAPAASGTEEPALVAESQPGEQPQPAETTPAPQNDLTLLAQVKTPENFPEIRNRMELETMKEAVATSDIPVKEPEPIVFTSTVEVNVAPAISFGKVVVAPTPPNQLIPSASTMMQAPPTSPMKTAETLALYDRNKNGRLDPNEVAAMRTPKIAYVAPQNRSETIKLSGFQVGAEKEANGGSRFLQRPARPSPEMMRTQLQLRSPPAGARFGGNSNTEEYAHTGDNDFLSAQQNPLSTFSIDTDTASYANVRRLLQGGTLPPRDAVRVEELLNYFPYNYAPPKDDAPFAAALEVASAPWAPEHRLVRVGLKGRDVATADRPAANLVFLLDVSGSMNAPNKLPLVQEAMRLLVKKLRVDDRVAIVVYAGASGLALPSTPVSKSREILDALDELEAGGSTNGAMGIQLAYDIAKANFVTGGLNRVILCTDGDFNVGVTSEGDLTRLIEEKAKTGVFLTVLGFGMGNLKDNKLEKLADKGNGNYGYIDTRAEAEKMLVEQVSGTLMTIAKDVKIQVEFNPAKVASYRLIGYENRLLKKEDFNNDKVDAGEIGAGHTLTALYEVVPVGAENKSTEGSAAVDDLKYQTARPAASRAGAPASDAGNELLTVKVRYKKPDGILSRKLDFALVDRGTVFANASADFKFAAAVAGFGMILRDSPHKGAATLGDVLAWAGPASNDDPRGYRGEFITLVNLAKSLTP